LALYLSTLPSMHSLVCRPTYIQQPFYR
jgi:hypothetical protein